MRSSTSKQLIALCLLAAAIAATARPGVARAQADPAAAAIGAALQGDAARARALMLAAGAELDEADIRLQRCLAERFAPGAAPVAAPADLDGLARSALQAYRAYWQRALLNPADAAEAEDALRERLREALRMPTGTGLDSLTRELNNRLAREGRRSLQGRTGRLQEFMLWRRQEERTYAVALPEGPFDVQVVLLNDFASLGWGDYATCGRRGAGGWARSDRLFAVAPRYGSLEGEEFRVTFLGHETQHFADLRRWPELAAWRLEYRAKLVELAQADATRSRVLRKFEEDQGDDPASPHSYANRRVLAALTARLELGSSGELASHPLAEVQGMARRLLLEDTRDLPRPSGSRN